MSYLGLDIGMTGAKALVVGEKGDVLRREYTTYGSDYAKRLSAEIDPRHIWAGVRDIVQACQCKGMRDPVKAISASVSGDDFFPAGRAGRPLANVISAYQDTGKEYEQAILERGGGEEQLFEITGQPIRGNIYPLHRILWIKENCPDVYDKTWKFMCWEDYINYMLTGECVSDYSLVSRTLLFDIKKRAWSRPLMEKMGLDHDKFPRVDAPGTVVGTVKPDVADELGLPSECLVATGGFDQAAASLGAGITVPSVLSLGVGTVIASHWLVGDVSGVRSRDYSYCCSLAGDAHLGMFFSFNGCAVLNWFFREFGGGKEGSVEGHGLYEHYNSQIASGAPSSLFMMPHLGGARQPYDDPSSRGAVIGIRLNTTSADILKSVYEGIAFDLKRNYELLKKHDVEIAEIRAVGGGSRSSVWMQLMANILGCEVATLAVDEGSAMGAAVLGACAVRAFASAEEAAGAWIGKKDVFVPEGGIGSEFEDKYQKYCSLYEQIRAHNEFLTRYDDAPREAQ